MIRVGKKQWCLRLKARFADDGNLLFKQGMRETYHGFIYMNRDPPYRQEDVTPIHIRSKESISQPFKSMDDENDWHAWIQKSLKQQARVTGAVIAPLKENCRNLWNFPLPLLPPPPSHSASPPPPLPPKEIPTPRDTQTRDDNM